MVKKKKNPFYDNDRTNKQIKTHHSRLRTWVVVPIGSAVGRPS